jgi:hypothetical protein
MSTSFQTAAGSLQKLNPAKRVNYTFGLVLGVEEFLQSDAYFLAKHHVENSLLHGYGTVCGLDVTSVTSPQLEVRVSPGWATNPKGQAIHVSQLMCVKLNDWLQANAQALQDLLGPAPSTLPLCVVLCYRECETDTVPIPGEPCRTAADSMAASRIADSFELMLCVDRDQPLGSPPVASPPVGSPSSGTDLCQFRPTQVEDEAMRALAALLTQIEPSSTGPFLTLSQLLDLVRGLAAPLTSPPVASPPVGPPWLVRVPTRLLQEMAVGTASAAGAASSYRAVGAGGFRMDGSPNGPVFNLTAMPAPAGSGEFLLNFAGYRNPGTTPSLNYVVKGVVQDTVAAGAARATFEFVAFEAGGIRVRVLHDNNVVPAAQFGFMAEISQIGGA